MGLNWIFDKFDGRQAIARLETRISHHDYWVLLHHFLQVHPIDCTCFVMFDCAFDGIHWNLSHVINRGLQHAFMLIDTAFQGFLVLRSLLVFLKFLAFKRVKRVRRLNRRVTLTRGEPLLFLGHRILSLRQLLLVPINCEISRLERVLWFLFRILFKQHRALLVYIFHGSWVLHFFYVFAIKNGIVVDLIHVILNLITLLWYV